jgi:orotate phosphoribosyltransferase
MRTESKMEKYQKEFLSFAIDIGVLKFGEFTLKSGRQSPYFFNSGLFNTGRSLAQLGSFYAQAIIRSAVEFDMIYGPAYKGIPLASALSITLANDYERDLPYAFNRKEVKDHGEGGIIVGSPLQGKVLIIDDVISAGTSVRESIDIIIAQGAQPAAVIIALDRQEVGKTDKTAIQEVESEFGIPVVSIVCLGDLINYLDQQTDMQQSVAAIKAYREKYGAK